LQAEENAEHHDDDINRNGKPIVFRDMIAEATNGHECLSIHARS